jgi:glycosyltransferase involved in cell wall biosynthesis
MPRRTLMQGFMGPSAFRAAAAAPANPVDRVAPPPPRRERLAIVSTSSKLCGIAAYTEALCRQLDDAFDITVFDLNQYLLRSPHRRVRKLADRHIKAICRAIRDFDVVNLQLEYGTLGRYGDDIHRRFRWLTEAAPRLSVTFHTLLTPEAFDFVMFMKALLTGQFKAAARIRSQFHRTHLLSHGIAQQLRTMQRRKKVSAIVHNQRDLCDIRYLYGIDQSFDHPLAYLGAGEIDAIRREASLRRFAMLDDLPPDAVLVGVFGFLNEYKGIATAIRALRHLPGSFHLLIFGGIHPQEIMQRQPRHPYLSSLFDEAHLDTTLFDQFRDGSAERVPQLVISGAEVLRELSGAHPGELSARLHFMGALDEADFLAGMAICNAVVFPYLEVGQSSSGPISQALELGSRIIASRTHAFLEFARYHRNAIEFFDIGNHLELAERLLAHRQYPPRPGLPEFNVETNKATYLLANSVVAIPPPAGRQPGFVEVRTRASLGR